MKAKAIMGTVLTCIMLLDLYGLPSSLLHDTTKLKKPVYRSIRFVDNLHGWIAGYRGIFYTDDGGKSWRKQLVTTGSADMYTVAAAVNDTGWIAWADAHEAIIRSDTGLVVGKIDSKDWRRITIPLQILARMYSVAFADQHDGMAVGNSVVFLTKDGGSSWQNVDLQLVVPAKSVFALSSVDFWIAGGLTTLAHTVDGGDSFHQERLSMGSTADLLFITFVDVNNGWACGTDGLIYHTTSGGRSWVQQTTPFSRGTVFSSLSFVSREEGWAIGSKYLGNGSEKNELFENVILYTTDGGVTWLSRKVNTKDSLLSIQALPNGRAWVVGIDGTVLHTSDEGKNWRLITIN